MHLYVKLLRSKMEHFKYICRYTASSLALPIFASVYFSLPLKIFLRRTILSQK
jgi:hypothetical protein